MARRDRIKQGLGAVLKSTTGESGGEATDATPGPVEETPPARKPASVRRVTRKPKPAADPEPQIAEPSGENAGDKRHTSVYLHPSEFDLLDDTIYALRRDHGVRIPKTELWRALLHLAAGMMADPERVDELLAACSLIAEEE